MQAILRSARLSPKKARIISGMLRGRHALEALVWLMHAPTKAAGAFRKVLRSAIANAQHNGKIAPERLFVQEAKVDEGARYRRWRAGSKGRAKPFRRPTAHLSIQLAAAVLPEGHDHDHAGHDHSHDESPATPAEKAPAKS